MAVTATILGRAVPGNLARVRAVITGDTSYPTGGYLITPALFGFQFLGHAVCTGLSSIGGTVVGDAVFNEATNRLLFVSPAGTEVANATNVSTITVNLEGFGN